MPALSTIRPEAGRQHRVPAPADAVTGLTAYAAVLLLLPSDRIIPQLGGSGTPAALLSIGLMVWWLWYRTRLASRLRFTNPVYLAFMAFVAAVMASEIVAASSTLPQADQNAADMGIMRLAGFAGAFFVAADGIPSRQRLAVLCRRLVSLGTIVALLGIAQFLTGTVVIDRLPTPGLASIGGGEDLRSGFLRPRGTARHALEFASVVCGILPVALALCMGDRARSRISRLVPVAVLAAVTFVSLTRSALIGLLLGVLSMMPFWTPQLRRRTVALGVLGAAGLMVAMPQLLRAILAMFEGGDSSVASRTGSWDFAFQVFSTNPVIGRGFGTFLPSYRILDNQLLLLVLEIGVAGALAFVALLMAGVYCAFAGRNAGDDSLDGHLGLGLGASIISSAALMAFFDSFSFPQAPGVLFMVLGMSAAYWRLSKESERLHPRIIVSSLSHGQARLLAATAAVLVLLCALPVAQAIRQVPGVYWAQQDLVFLPPASSVGGNSLRTDARDLVPFAAMVQEAYEGKNGPSSIEPVSAPIYGTGIGEGQLIRVPNAGGQWETYQKEATITVEAMAATEQEVHDALERTMSGLGQLAMAPQQDMEVVRSARIITNVHPEIAVPVYVEPRTDWALLLLGFGTVVVSATVHEAVLRRTGWS